MSPTDLLSRDVAVALDMVITRLKPELDLPWMLMGEVAQTLQGVILTEPSSEIAIITGAAEIGRIVSMLDVSEREPLATRSVAGFTASPRGIYTLNGASSNNPMLTIAGDARAVGDAGELSLALERIWSLRVPQTIDDTSVALMPLEIELVVALLHGEQATCYTLAEHLFVVGTRWERLEAALAQVPALEQPLWELMDEVRPMAKRARGRRVRQQTGWGKKRP